MTNRIAAAIAAAFLTSAIPAGSAIAQEAGTLNVWGARVNPTNGPFGAQRSYDDITTGSTVVAPRGGRQGVGSSAKEGNAEETNRLVPNYGGTAGGPAY